MAPTAMMQAVAMLISQVYITGENRTRCNYYYILAKHISIILQHYPAYCLPSLKSFLFRFLTPVNFMVGVFLATSPSFGLATTAWMLTCAATMLVATDDGQKNKTKKNKKGTTAKKEKVEAGGNVTIFHVNAPSVPKTATSVPLSRASEETGGGGGGGSKVSKWRPAEPTNQQWKPLDTTRGEKWKALDTTGGKKWAPARDGPVRW